MKPNASNHKYLRVKVYWGDILYDTAVFTPGKAVTVGPTPESRFVLDLDPAFKHKSWVLAAPGRKKTAKLTFFSQTRGHVETGGQATPLRLLIEQKKLKPNRQGAYQIPLAGNETAGFVYGDISFYLDWVAHRGNIPRGRRPKPVAVMSTLIASTLLGILMWGIQQMPVPLKPPPPPNRVVKILEADELPQLAPLPPEPIKPVDAKPELKPEAPAPAQKITTTPPPAPAKINKPVRHAKPAGPVANKAVAPPLSADSEMGSVLDGLNSLRVQGPKIPNGDSLAGFGGSESAQIDSPTSVSLKNTKGQGTGAFHKASARVIAADSTGEGSVSGGLKREEIDAVVHGGLNQVRRCYEQGLAASPKMVGRIALQFVIGGSGRITSETVTSDTLANKSVTRCILAQVKSWHFPRPVGNADVSVEYPFDFSPGD